MPSKGQFLLWKRSYEQTDWDSPDHKTLKPESVATLKHLSNTSLQTGALVGTSHRLCKPLLELLCKPALAGGSCPRLPASPHLQNVHSHVPEQTWSGGICKVLNFPRASPSHAGSRHPSCLKSAPLEVLHVQIQKKVDPSSALSASTWRSHKA